ncbi:hypothetical protein QE152_g29369 [Popillia japonica]|uniref:Uncharacterized protein n=1 Tax=Popillia japonica TaxID=7064 RepID=A0AAW1JHU2_POPJA
MKKFEHKLRHQVWHDVYSADGVNVNEQWLIFMCSFKTMFEECFPKELITKKYQNNALYKNVDEVMYVKRRLDLLLIMKNVNSDYSVMYVKRRLDLLLIMKNVNSDYSDMYKKTKKERFISQMPI